MYLSRDLESSGRVEIVLYDLSSSLGFLCPLYNTIAHTELSSGKENRLIFLIIVRDTGERVKITGKPSLNIILNSLDHPFYVIRRLIRHFDKS